MGKRIKGARLGSAAAAGLFALALGVPGAAAAEHIKVGVVRSLGGAPEYVAQAKGYFADEGLDAELVLFDSAQPIAVAAAAGDIDFGTTGMTVAFFTLANAGTLKIIGAGAWEHPGFESIGFMVSNQAYAAGVHSFKELGGHSVAVTQYGSPLDYNLSLVLAKYGVDQKTVRVLALQSNPNIASAVTGGQADAAVQTAANIYALVNKGNAKVLGWVGSELPPGQSEGTFTTAKLANEQPDTVKHFLAAVRRAETAWDAAFADAKGERADQATAPEMVAIVAKALKQPPDVIKLGIGYYDPQARVSVPDIRRVLDWYWGRGFLKTHIDADTLIDPRYAIEVSAR